MEVLYYGDHEEQLIDVYASNDKNGKHADKWIVLVHGGYWRQKFDRSLNDKMIEVLTNKGYNVANVEYRRGEHKWPIPEEDVKKAVQTFRNSEFVGEGQSLILIGHSVGGQLVLNNEDEADRIVALSPVTDVPYTKAKELGRNAAEEYFGDVSEDILYAASPISRLPLNTKTLIIHGFDDTQVEIDTTIDYVTKNTENTIDLYAFSSLAHMDNIEPEGRHFDLMLEWVDQEQENEEN
ncbi:alpha/beta hydrolase family protein [Staphylococcus simulans]|uniref:alpha/beta hydrolase family protein n=1 Tax=Staphylococcus simulans TaxID=1286 RepID=UPI000D1DC24A|nr:alpha/beta hydrolase [Staphylococcus simulans]PTI94023.1 alpha/beta hydrolase [Staphylococcus simulans]PTJ04840.1 alpha/beta hydrolase [Staphylococcus simulans]PTJ09022.1 alpha/beta hydrolase [Staphylococcus simulans]PTJ40588.1 alpha/beta hydrolase [Staphylococcus simulans]PTJ96346.1 alpha/beta hydrolase [Staphylococcus simulans]